MKRLYKVDVTVEFESTDETVYVWAEDEGEAENIAEEDVDDMGTEPAGIESLRVNSCDEATKEEFEHELKYHPTRWLPGTTPGGSLLGMEAEIRESLAEEERAMEAWSAQSVLPGFTKPPLPSRCEECGARPPLIAHRETCSQRTRPDGGPCEAVTEEGAKS